MNELSVKWEAGRRARLSKQPLLVSHSSQMRILSIVLEEGRFRHRNDGGWVPSLLRPLPQDLGEARSVPEGGECQQAHLQPKWEETLRSNANGWRVRLSGFRANVEAHQSRVARKEGVDSRG